MTKITGHRGARNLWPENSLTGFRNVLALGVDAVEFDVHLTDAGELVVIHDATLDRTAEGSGPVRRLAPAERTHMRLKGSSDVVPTLDEVLDILSSASDKNLHVEIKSDADGKAYAGIVENVVAAIDRHGIRERCHLTSFDHDVLEDCRRAAPDIERLVSINASSAERLGGFERALSRAGELASIVAIHHELLERHWEFISATMPLEQLCVWTLNDPDLIRTWLDRKIGYLTSDSPDLALGLRDKARLPA